MARCDYDLIVVGGGLAGSAIGKAIAENGARVLIVEREERFRDRVRGEGVFSWGCAEAERLGIYRLLLETCAMEKRYIIGPGPERDLPSTTIQKLPSIAFYHPRMQQVMIDAAANAGAEVRRGLGVVGVEAGTPPVVQIQTTSGIEKLSARLIVGADGRGSALRKWAGFSEQRDPDALLIAGVCLEGMSNLRNDAIYFYLNPDLAEASFVVTTGPATTRAYVGYRAERGYRFNGPEALPRFIEESVKCGLSPDMYLKAKMAGPLATFNCADNWVEHPYSNGIALIGDAAASSNPDWGQGLSLTLRDARALRDALMADDDWDRAGRAYASAHDQYYSAVHNYERVLTDFFYGTTELDRARRAKALPLIAEDPMRMPDNLNCGPDLPLDESVLRRFYGEE